jgi:ACR3 family arsenite efflux pump ArsB
VPRVTPDPYFTLSQVALNDTIMIFAFAPIVAPSEVPWSSN